MQQLNYYVLWKKDSYILGKYMNLYYKKIYSLLCQIKFPSESYSILDFWEYKSEEKIKKFLLHPNVSSIINFISWNQHSNDIYYYQRILEWFLAKFISQNYNYDFSVNSNKLNNNITLTPLAINPYSWNDSHPDHEDNILWSYWDFEVKDWISIINASLQILEVVDEGFHSEISLIIKEIVPLWTSETLNNSWSYKWCIGVLYVWLLTWVKDPEIFALESIIHEYSHTKLNLVMTFDGVIACDWKAQYYSAIRPDARPISWVFLWYHAFAPTLLIIIKAFISWFIKDKKSWEERIALYYFKLKFLQKTIKKHAHFSLIWKDINFELDYTVSEIDDLYSKIWVSKSTIMKVYVWQKNHFQEVNTKYNNLKY